VYAVEFLPSAARTLARLDAAVKRRIAAAVDRLAEDPRPNGAVKLRGNGDVWRTRVGDYRVLYAIEDDRLVVLIIKIGHRRDVYR
jgi:mRNA interferase RelE/StbE